MKRLLVLALIPAAGFADEIANRYSPTFDRAQSEQACRAVVKDAIQSCALRYLASKADYNRCTWGIKDLQERCISRVEEEAEAKEEKAQQQFDDERNRQISAANSEAQRRTQNIAPDLLLSCGDISVSVWTKNGRCNDSVCSITATRLDWAQSSYSSFSIDRITGILTRYGRYNTEKKQCALQAAPKF